MSSSELSLQIIVKKGILNKFVYLLSRNLLVKKGTLQNKV